MKYEQPTHSYKDLLLIKSYDDEEREILLSRILLLELGTIDRRYDLMLSLLFEEDGIPRSEEQKADISSTLKSIDQDRAIIYDELISLGYARRRKDKLHMDFVLQTGIIDEEEEK